MLLLFIWLFWIGYCAYLTIWQTYKAGTLHPIAKAFAAPFLLIFGLADIVINLFPGSLIYLQPPRYPTEWTLSIRTSRVLHHPIDNPNEIDRWRLRVARFLAAVFLNPESEAVGAGPHV